MSKRFEDAVQSLSRDDRFRATVYAMNTLLIQRGLYTRNEFELLFLEWAEKEHSITEAEPPKAWVRPIPVGAILGAVCRHFAITPEDIRTHSNRPRYLGPRQVAMFLLSTHCGWSLGRIGNYLGGFHHTTVHHGLRAIERRRAEDPKLEELISVITHELFSPAPDNSQVVRPQEEGAA